MYWVTPATETAVSGNIEDGVEDEVRGVMQRESEGQDLDRKESRTKTPADKRSR